MTCERVVHDGQTFLLCGKRKKVSHACFNCGNVAAFQCDFPVRANNIKKTCDRWMCEECRNAIGPNSDLCAEHFTEYHGGGLAL